MTLTLASTNGSKSHSSSEAWLQASVQSFFAALNWEDNPPEVQQVKIASAQSENAGPLSLTLTVNQFFAALNWDGAAIAAPVQQQAPTQPAADTFTLDAFSDLF